MKQVCDGYPSKPTVAAAGSHGAAKSHGAAGLGRAAGLDSAARSHAAARSGRPAQGRGPSDATGVRNRSRNRPGIDQGTVPKKPGRGHGSIFDRIDSTVRVFLGPADRSEGDLPVVHRHDEAEDFSEETLGSIEIHEDSLGHHYAQQRRRPEQ